MNADSLSTWVLPALAPLSAELSLELLREGEDHTADLLRDGSAMAAITTERTPVQGCTVERLGAMRYQPMAAPAFAARWFPDGLTAAALSVAPLVVFDAKDRMQHRVLRRHGVSSDPPIHLVPASTQYVEAVRLGFGWGMVPDLQRAGWTSEDGVVLSTARMPRRWPCSGSSGRCGRRVWSRSPRRSGPRRLENLRRDWVEYGGRTAVPTPSARRAAGAQSPELLETWETHRSARSC